MQNKLALITGGAKGIGRDIAIFLASLGYDIAITFKSSKDDANQLLELLKNDYGVAVFANKLDLFDESAVKNFSSEFFLGHKNCSLVVNNASIFEKGSFVQDDLEKLDDNMAIHLKSPLIIAKEFAKNVTNNEIKDAQIINMIDKNIARYETSYFYYLLSKKSLSEATKMIALQLAPHIRVNGIAPGYFSGPVDDNAVIDNKAQKIINKIPLQKKGNKENIILTLDFLLKNDFITGQVIAVDGGASLNHAG